MYENLKINSQNENEITDGCVVTMLLAIHRHVSIAGVITRNRAETHNKLGYLYSNTYSYSPQVDLLDERWTGCTKSVFM